MVEMEAPGCVGGGRGICFAGLRSVAGVELSTWTGVRFHNAVACCGARCYWT